MLTSPAQYAAGFVLCLFISFVYALARRDKPRAVVKETLLVFVYTLGVIASVTLVVLLACKWK